jgi:predicted RNA-binding Zn-ribbon protein involved in translation (DUF1610 family)
MADNDATLPPCPNCGERNCTVTAGLVVTGLAPVAGVQVKAAAVEGFRFNCPDCGAFGRAYPPPAPHFGRPASAIPLQ